MSDDVRILAATRDPEHTRLVLDLAGHLSRSLGASVTLLTVLRDEADRGDGQAVLHRAMELLGDRLPGGRAAPLQRIGHPAEEILDELEAGDYALVVLGDREHQNPLARLVLGSTVERVIEHAPCAVAVAKGQVGPIRSVLLCDGGAAESPLVEVVAAQLPDLLARADIVTVLHVRSEMSAGPSAASPETGDAAEAHDASRESRVIERELAALGRLGIRTRLVLRQGLVVDEVAAEAEASAADLVVIGAHRGEGWRRVLISNVAREIFREVQRPILVMRPPSA